MIYGLRAFGWLLLLTVWHALRVSVAALARVPDRQGGFYDTEVREWGRRLLRVTRLPVQVEGLDRLDPGRGYVYAANHASFVDVWLLVATLPGSIRFVAKRELLRVPLIGSAMRATGQITVDRQDRDAAERAYETAADVLRRGRSIIVFVEGTRSPDGRLGEFKKGAFVLAIEAGAPLVPVYLRGTAAAMPRGGLWLRHRPVGLVIGDLIPTTGLTYADRDALLGRTRAWFVAQQERVDPARSAG